MSTSSGRRPVLAALAAEQVPLIGETSALLGLTAGIKNALHLAVYHAELDVVTFDAALHEIRTNPRYDIDFSRAFAAGYTVAASEVRRIGGIK